MERDKARLQTGMTRRQLEKKGGKVTTSQKGRWRMLTVRID